VQRAMARFRDYWSVRAIPGLPNDATHAALGNWRSLGELVRRDHLGAMLPSTTKGTIDGLIRRSVRAWAQLDFAQIQPKAVELHMRDLVGGETFFDLDDADRVGPPVPLLRLRVAIASKPGQRPRKFAIAGFEPCREAFRPASFSLSPHEALLMFALFMLADHGAETSIAPPRDPIAHDAALFRAYSVVTGSNIGQIAHSLGQHVHNWDQRYAILESHVEAADVEHCRVVRQRVTGWR